MTRSDLVAAVLLLSFTLGLHHTVPAFAQEAPGLSGSWTLNPALSQGPREVGFNTEMPMPTGPDAATGGERSQPGGGARPFVARRESLDDANRVRLLTDEVREPSAHLTIVDTPTAVTITDARGQARTLHPNGQEDVVQLGDVPVHVIAKREAGQLMVLYEAEQGRELRYTYSRVATPVQLVVDVQFVERGGGDRVKRVYEPARAAAPTSAAAAPPAAPSAAAPPTNATPGAQAFNSRPGAEFKGLTTLGLVVEDLGTQATACGLNQATLEAAVSKHLSDAGLKVRRNSDEDTYVYVNVMTASVSTGLCVSRYDASLTTHTTATLSYQQSPVLVEVSLLHKGGIAGGAPAAHAASVLKGVLEYVDQFASRIRDANQ